MSSRAPAISSPWLTLEEAARYARCSATTLLRQARTGRCRGFKLASGKRCWRFKVDDLDTWIESNAQLVPFAPRKRA